MPHGIIVEGEDIALHSTSVDNSSVDNQENNEE
jgi:hypothetical protein